MWVKCGVGLIGGMVAEGMEVTRDQREGETWMRRVEGVPLPLHLHLPL